MSSNKLINWYDLSQAPSSGVLSLKKQTDKVFHMLLNNNLASVWEYAELQTAIRILSDYLDSSTDRGYETIVSFLSQYVGQDMTVQALQGLAEIVIGWLPEFKQGIPFVKWNGVQPVWSVLFAETVKHATIPGKYWMECKCIKGPATGFHVRKLFDERNGRRLFKDLCSLSFDDYAEIPAAINLGGMYFIATIEVSDRGVQMSQAMCSQGQKEYNRKLLQRRKGKCIGGFSQEACTVYCPYSRDSCILSCHAETYYIGNCKNSLIRHRGYLMQDGWCSKCLREGRVAIDKNVIKEEVSKPC